MGSLDGLSACLEPLEFKNSSITKAILKLAVGWKSFDEHLDSTQKFFNEGQELMDCEMKQNILLSQQDAIVESNKKLSLGWESLKLKLEELECREEKFDSFQREQQEEFKAREEKMEKTRRFVAEKVEEFGLREERLIEKKKLMEGLLQKFEREKEEFMGIAKSVRKKLDVIEMREMHCDERCEELDLIQDFVLGRLRELDSREKQVKGREDQVEAILKSNDQRCKEHEISLKNQSDKLDSVRALLERKTKEFDKKEKELELREKQIKAVPFNEEHLKELEIKVQDRYRVLDLLQDLTNNWAKKLDLEGREVAISKFFSLQEKVYEYIREHVGKGLHLTAIRYVCLFDLGSEFSPATLLKEYVSHVEAAVEQIRMEGHFSLNAQDMAIKKELIAIKAMRNCIRTYKLESEYTLESLEARIERLEKQKTDLESFTSSPPTKTQSQKRSDFQRRETYAKKRKGYFLEHAIKPQIEAFSEEMLHQTAMPQHQHQPLFPIQVPHH